MFHVSKQIGQLSEVFCSCIEVLMILVGIIGLVLQLAEYLWFNLPGIIAAENQKTLFDIHCMSLFSSLFHSRFSLTEYSEH